MLEKPHPNFFSARLPVRLPASKEDAPSLQVQATSPTRFVPVDWEMGSSAPDTPEERILTGVGSGPA